MAKIKTNRRKPPGRDEKIKTLFDTGCSKSEIAAATGLTVSGVRLALLRLTDYSYSPRTLPSAERDAQMIDFYNEGHSFGEIASLFGMHAGSVARALIRLGRRVPERKSPERKARVEPIEPKKRRAPSRAAEYIAAAAEGVPQVEIARRFGVSKQAIHSVLRQHKGRS